VLAERDPQRRQIGGGMDPAGVLARDQDSLFASPEPQEMRVPAAEQRTRVAGVVAAVAVAKVDGGPHRPLRG
jgi:hypothetical protein